MKIEFTPEQLKAISAIKHRQPGETEAEWLERVRIETRAALGITHQGQTEEQQEEVDGR